MYWLLSLMTVSFVAILTLGVYFMARPLSADARAKGWLQGTVGLNLITYFGALVGILFLGVHDVLAAEPAAAGVAKEVSVGLGLALIGIGIPTGLAAIGAGIAVGPVGAASLAVIVEKPEMLGRSLVYLGLAEGIAIYGLVVTILLLGRI
jgi:V/A-type H+-transporting ATPase subunit K